MASHPVAGMSPWLRALMAARLLSIAPTALGGIVVRARTGPARTAWFTYVRKHLEGNGSLVDIPAHISDDRLLGGLDLAESLRSGTPCISQGTLQKANGGIAVISGAERISRQTIANITRALDCGGIDLQRDGLAHWFPSRFGVIAFDEALDDEPGLDRALADRLALQIDLDGVPLRDVRSIQIDDARDIRLVAESRKIYSRIETPPGAIDWLCHAAATFGVASLRRPAQALEVARAHAALSGRQAIDEADLIASAAFVLAPRATMQPAPADAPEESAPEEQHERPPAPLPEENECTSSEDTSIANEDTPQAMHDLVVDALKVHLPPNLLPPLTDAAKLGGGALQGSSGPPQKSLENGVRTGITNGRPERGAQLSIYATLLAAAPHQKLRAREREAAGRATIRDGRANRSLLRIQAEDFRIFRRKQRRKTLTIFAVDASGSSALNRLSEAKGAIELLLGDCYVRRDEIALITFRRNGADIALPPTAALARAKRCLASLPGGGGTPLASALATASSLAHTYRRRGLTPFIILLTDGRANVTRAGTQGRRQAMADALDEARRCRALSLDSIVIDTAPVPDERSSNLAAALGADYLALPKANSETICQAAQATRNVLA